MKRKNKNEHTGHKVVEGTSKPASLNPKASDLVKADSKYWADPHHISSNIFKGDRIALSKAITIAESTLPADETIAEIILEACLPQSGNSFRIAVTGPPGVGKSTFIEALGEYLTGLDKKIAVLSIDPSSSLSGGSILGDKTRMEKLSRNKHAFIRPTASGKNLGGVADGTRESIILCEAAGFDTIIIETVGVGQSGTSAWSMTDFFLLLLQPGSGDELQGIKRGIVELADLLVVNKADGALKQKAMESKREFGAALHLYPPKENGWSPKVLTCSAIENQGMEDIWKEVELFKSQSEKSGFFIERRMKQNQAWLEEKITEGLLTKFRKHPLVSKALEEMNKQVLSGKITPIRAAKELLGIFAKEK